MAFPVSPTNGQTYTANGVTYIYDSGLGVWNLTGAVSTASPVSSVAGRTGAVTLTAADIGAGTFAGTVTGSTINATTLNVGTITALSSSITVTSSITFSGGTQFTSLGVGTAASGTAGEIRATNAITAYYSDERLKNKISNIENALDKIDQLSGFLYRENELANSFGFNNPDVQVALSAQDVNRVQPEAVRPAPFDIAKRDDGTEYSKSGEEYLTVLYDRLVPLLVEGIKELRREINQLKGK